METSNQTFSFAFDDLRKPLFGHFCLHVGAALSSASDSRKRNRDNKPESKQPKQQQQVQANHGVQEHNALNEESSAAAR